MLRRLPISIPPATNATIKSDLRRLDCCCHATPRHPPARAASLGAEAGTSCGCSPTRAGSFDQRATQTPSGDPLLRTTELACWTILDSTADAIA